MSGKVDGARLLAVSGRSMGRRFAKADSFLIRPADPEQVLPGALVAFKVRNGEPLLHRLILKYRRKGTLYFLTRGDGNRHFDQAWPASCLLGEAEAMLSGEDLEPLEGAGFALRAKWKLFTGTIRAGVAGHGR